MWEEVLADRKTYPDEMEVDLAGKKSTVGELRKKAGLTADFTKHTQKVEGEKRKLEQALLEHQTALVKATDAIEEAKAKSVQQTGSEDNFETYLHDPIWKPVASRVAKIDDLEKKIARLEGQVQGHEQTWYRNLYTNQKAAIKKADPDADPDAIATYALERQIPDLFDAYKAREFDRLAKKIADESEKKGYERAKAEPPPPPVSSGARRMGSKPPPEQPKDLDAALDAAERDPEILKLMNG